MTICETIRAFLAAPNRNAEILADIDRRGKAAYLDYVAAGIIAKAAYRGGKVDELNAALERVENENKV